MNAAALPVGAAWEEDTAPESSRVEYAAPPVASPVVAAARRGILFVLGALGGLLLGLAILAAIF